MKTTINKDGMLTIQPQTELEAYALKKWADQNIVENNINTENLLFHLDPITTEDNIKCNDIGFFCGKEFDGKMEHCFKQCDNCKNICDGK